MTPQRLLYLARGSPPDPTHRGRRWRPCVATAPPS